MLQVGQGRIPWKKNVADAGDGQHIATDKEEKASGELIAETTCLLTLWKR